VTDDLARQIFTTWEGMAPGWEKWRETIWEVSEHVGRQLVDMIDPRPGETILELAAGVGDTGFLAAERVAPDGRVISSDFSPAMVDAARRRAAELGVTGIDFRILDAQALDLADGSVDGVVCRWGYMLMPDPAAALSETRRVLRPNGRLAFSVWGPPEENPWSALVARALVDAGHMDPPQPGRPGIFALADTERIERLVVDAGFEAPQIAELSMQWPFESFEDYWAFILEKAGALSTVIEPLPDEEHAAVRASVRETLGRRAEGSFELSGLCLNVSARVPGAAGANFDAQPRGREAGAFRD
jgi:SAM-dependent methyltransferase